MYSLMYLLFFTTVIGAISNRMRGGGLHDVVSANPNLIKLCSKLRLWKNGSLLYVKDLNALIFGCWFGYLTTFGFIPLYYLAMRISFAPGWGGYIGAMVDRKTYHDRKDVLLLDKWFRSNTYPVLSGYLALTLRGLMTTCILALPFIPYTPHWILLMLIGASMGSIYLLCIEVCGRITNRMNGWQWGEYVYGAFLWGAYHVALFPQSIM